MSVASQACNVPGRLFFQLSVCSAQTMASLLPFAEMEGVGPG